MTKGLSAEKSKKQIANELRENVKMRLAEGFLNAENEMLIDNGSSLILRIGGAGGTDIEIKIIIKKEQFEIEIEEPEVEPEVELETE